MNDQKIKFSIIIPIFNAEKTIKDTINSIVKQKYSNYEIICVNDCSTDGTDSILTDISNITIKKINHSQNLGSLISRHDGLRVATGDYILFLDSDDSFTENALYELYQNISSFNFPEIMEFAYLRTPINTIMQPIELHKINATNKNIGEGLVSFTLWNKVYKNDLIVRSLPFLKDFKATIADDYYDSFVLLFNSCRYVQIQNVLYQYTVGSGMSTNSKGLEVKQIHTILQSIRAVVNNLYSFASKKHNSNINSEIKNIYKKLLNDFFMYYLNNVVSYKSKITVYIQIYMFYFYDLTIVVYTSKFFYKSEIVRWLHKIKKKLI